MKLPANTEIEKFFESIKNRVNSDYPARRFILSMKNRMGIGSPERNATDTYEREMEIVPACIKANENEIPVKQYNIAVLRNLLKFERAEGRMQVTNKRVIFRAAGRSVGGRTTLQHEFAIDEIAGIEARSNFKFSLLYVVFAVFISVAASLLLYQSPFNFRVRPPEFSLSDFNPLPGIEWNTAQGNRISKIMYPKHVQRAYGNVQIAISQRTQAEENLSETEKNLEAYMEVEEKAFGNVTRGIQKTRRVQTGTNWRGQPEYSTQTYRDTSPEGLIEAQYILDSAIAEREQAEMQLETAKTNLKTARTNESKAIKKRETTVMTWRVLMTLFGLIVGFIGLAPFFLLNKRFGLKLFILNFSIFGFALSLNASGFRIFSWLVMLSNIITLICVFLYCFRPNLVISIKNKGGADAVDIRRDTIFTRREERGTGFSEIIPTDESESVIREIGAIINDIQKLGDLGLQKWIK